MRSFCAFVAIVACAISSDFSVPAANEEPEATGEDYFVEKVPKPETESAMLLPVMGIHYLRVVKGTQNQDGWTGEKSLMLSLDLTGQSGAIHSGNLERMLNGNDETRQAVLKEFSPGRLKAIGAMLLQGRDEKEKVRLMKKFPYLFRAGRVRIDSHSQRLSH